MNEPWGSYAKWNKSDTKGQNIIRLYLQRAPEAIKFITTESRTEVARGWGTGMGGKGENGELSFNVYGVSVWDDENFLEMGGSDGNRAMRICLIPLKWYT